MLNHENNKTELLLRTVKTGARYAYDLFDSYGNLVLEAHTPFSDSMLKHLQENKVDYLYYNPAEMVKETDAHKNDFGLDVSKNVVSDELKDELTDHAYNFLEHVREAYAGGGNADNLSKNKIDISRSVVDKILEEVEENKDGVFDPFFTVKNMDEYTYRHSSNVSILASILSSRLDFKKEIRSQMGLGGLLHDLGKSSISKDVVTKVKLTDEDFNLLKEHPHVGYKLVENYKFLSDLEKQIILLHHERADSSGFPFGFDLEHYEERTPREVRLIGICDLFTALVSQKPWNDGMSSRQALRFILNKVYAPYKQEYYFLHNDFRDFIRGLGFIVNRGNYFITPGDIVRLNTGEVAIIEEMNQLYPMKPVVKIIKNRELETVKRPIQVDMLKNFTSYISNIFNKK